MWVAEDGDRIVAIRDFMPKRMKILGEAVVGAEMADSFTHPNYQGRGIFTSLSKAVRESIIDKGIGFIYNFPTEGTSLPAHLKKLEHVPVPIELCSLVYIISSKPWLKIKLRSSLLASVLSPVIDAIFRILFRIGLKGATKSDVQVFMELAFPDDIDTLWEKVSGNYDVILVRTKDYLEWRYITNPDTYSILIARNKKGALLGYMVTKVGFSEGILKGFICDFLTDESDPNVFKKLLCASLQDFCRKGVNAVSTLAVKDSFYYKILLKLGFLSHKKNLILCYKNEIGSQIVSQTYKWHFTMGDSDGI
jgi:hypothetical protein